MSPPNIQNSNFAKTPKMSFFEPKQPIVKGFQIGQKMKFQISNFT